MKYLLASDLHGSLKYAREFKNIIELEKPSFVIMLGDLYYHGPRNSLPFEYNPMEVAKILNSIKDKTVFIKGNCDSEVDTLISEFDFLPSVVFLLGNRRIYCTHGHLLDKEKLPFLRDGDILCYGHLHTGFIKMENSIIHINTGSLSLPKNDTKNSYVTIQACKDSNILIELKNLISGEIIDSLVL